MDEQGFYKFDGDLIFGTKIYGPYGDWNFFLDTLTEDKSGCTQEDGSIVTFPHDGWYYFDTRQEAVDFFGQAGE